MICIYICIYVLCVSVCVCVRQPVCVFVCPCRVCDCMLTLTLKPLGRCLALAGKLVSKRSYCMVTGEIVLSAHATALSSSSSEEVREWGQTGPGSMTEWVAWQPSWRLFDFDFLLAWGGRYGPALHQGQWWRWITWGTPLLILAAAAAACCCCCCLLVFMTHMLTELHGRSKDRCRRLMDISSFLL